VGVYFITQNPADVPEDILGQLGNRFQHALRAFTAKDRKELRMAADTYRENPRFSTEDAIKEVGVGEAVTSMLQKKGVPGIVERTLIRPPSSQLGPITKAERAAHIQGSDLAGKYEDRLDRKSAFEMLKARSETAAQEAAQAEEKAEELTPVLREFNAGRRYTAPRVARSTSRTTTRKGTGLGQAMTKMVVKELTGTTGRRIVRGILGGLFKGR
ncbi:MAG: helicase HerA-like domain-containing protein, partial [Paracoccaceae bacterium]